MTLRKFIIIVLFFIVHAAYAKPIVIQGKTIIDKPTIYRNVVLDLSDGYFQVLNDAKLTIENCIINGSISTKYVNLIDINSGHLILKNSKFNILSTDIPENPSSPSIYNLIHVSKGQASIIRNKFSINKSYTAGLFVADISSNINIIDNDIHNFHGGVILTDIHDAYIVNNRFSNVSISNILILNGTHSLFEKNTILFPGNNNVGDAIDIVNSENITLNQNYIASGSCYSIVVLHSDNIFINNNKIIGGITYAIYINTSIGTSDPNYKYLSAILNNETIKKLNSSYNQNIKVINNYIAQNRYGLTVHHVDGLLVKNNIFIQRFSDSLARKFWTDNSILLQNVSHVTWIKNLYKEAFDQNNVQEDDEFYRFVNFPLTGGVNLP